MEICQTNICGETELAHVDVTVSNVIFFCVVDLWLGYQ